MRNLLLLVFLPLSVFCQNTIGFPEVINYSKSGYNAGLQNWDIKQDKNGVIYFANNEGLLSFDGKYWKLYSLPNKTNVRSVEIGADNRIYVGGQDELGYFEPGKNGQLTYHSIAEFIPARDKSFGDVWDIVTYKKSVFFRSTYKIFQLENQTIVTYNAPKEWAYLGVSNGLLLAHDFSTGLMKFENLVWKPLFDRNALPVNDPVTAVLPLKNDRSCVTTLRNGIFIMSATGLTKLSSPNNALFENDRIYGATALNDDWIALATNNNGIYIIDLAGNIIQRFSKKEELQNNNVLSVFLDNQHNLWLGLDNGIDFIAYNSAIKHITPMLGDGSGYSLLIHDNRLYAGTSNGLSCVALQPVKDLSFSKGDFVPVTGTQGQVWNLSEVNNQLLLGHHEGAFRVENNTATRITAQNGFWNFVPLSPIFPSLQIVAGTYKGLMFFDYKGQQFLASKELAGFNESSRFIVIDSYKNIWVSQPYHGVYKISNNNEGSYHDIRTYSEKQGLPGTLNNHVYKIKNEVVVGTPKGVYVYNSQKDLFEPSAFYKNILGEQSIRYLKEDVSGNIWFIHEKNLGVIDLSGKKPQVIYLPELNNKMLSGFEFIYSADDNNVFLGGEKGFYHINYAKYKGTVPELQVQVRMVKISGNKDSLLFGGYFKGINEKQVQFASEVPSIAYKWKTFHFEFSSPLFDYQANLGYSYRLKGFDQNWSDWVKRTEKEYTNLPAGKYTFEVKVRNNLGNESPVSAYSFEVLPPWYQTGLAIFFYIILLAILLFTVYRWQRKKFLLQQKKYEEEQQKLLYIHELERNKAESELMSLRNQKLESDISFKNAELASSAMHLVKKGEVLTHVKTELSRIMKKLDDEKAITELKKMIRSLSDDDKIDKEWETFTRHFDMVHRDFILKLKEKHPAITGNEMKLSAYLRMNLSTKEIAQLMNISVRGVEISRYRLRKKLGITSEVSLFEYFIHID